MDFVVIITTIPKLPNVCIFMLRLYSAAFEANVGTVNGSISMAKF